MSMRRTHQVIAIVGLHVALAACSNQTPAPAPAIDTVRPEIPAEYQLVWADEFDKDGLPDPSKWAYDTGLNKTGWHNKELQYYSGPRAKNAQVRDGRLIITAHLESPQDNPDWGGQRYTSTRLLTRGKRDWTYGFFEIRAKLPCGKGTWPAIWMLNSREEWPAGGELDIMEHVGRDPGRVFSTVHTASRHGIGDGAHTMIPDACAAFHNYQMHWTADRVRFSVDGKLHYEYQKPSTDRARWPFDAPQFLILNIAIGGDLGGGVDDKVFPVSMEIAHVRVYQPRP